MLKNEYGNTLRVNAGFNLTSNINTLYLDSPLTSTGDLVITPADGLLVGSINIVTEVGTFLAGEYVEYVLLQGDIPYSGEWNARLVTQDTGADTCKITELPLSFVVGS